MTKSAKWAAEPSADNDGGICEGDAIDWLINQYGLSGGAATLQLKRAWDSGTVRSWDNLVEIGQHGETVLRDCKPVHIPPRISQLIPNGFVHDLRLHVDDLRWQIEQQIGKSPAGKAPKRQPSPGRRGRPEAPYWSKADEFIDNRLVENGCPQPGDGNQAKLEREVADFIAERTEEPPAKSTVRDHVRKRITKRMEQLVDRI
jgi:hypothetical protein